MPCWAKEEARELHWTWRQYGTSGGDFDSPEALLDAINQDQSSKFAACSVPDGACRTCTKYEYHAPLIPKWLAAKYNGKWTYLGNSSVTTTTYIPSCTLNGTTYPASGPVSRTDTSAGVGLSAILRCPHGYGAATKRVGEEVFDGVAYPVYESACIKRIPDPPSECCNTKFGNPIDAVSGAKLDAQTDYSSADGMLRVRRSYSSQTGRWNWSVDASLADFTGRGQHSAQTDLIANLKLVPAGIYASGATPPAVSTPRRFRFAIDPRVTNKLQVWLIGSNGSRTVFTESSGAFSTAAPGKPQLTLIAGPNGTQQWLYRMPQSGFQIFSMAGDLIREVRADGKSLSYTRFGNSLTVTASPGSRGLTYSRSTSSLAPPDYYDVVTLPDGNQIQYEIDTAGMVAGVTYADSARKGYVYNEPEHSTVDSLAQPPNRMTGAYDENNVRYATYKYDANGPISTELAGGVGKYSFYMPYPGYNAAFSEVTNPHNAQTRIEWNTGPDGEPRLTYRSQPAASGSTASASTVAYDASGNVASETDYKGAKTCYANDQTRGLETIRLEGLASGASCPANLATHPIPANTRPRKITTEWHPQWSFPVARAEPKKLTRWVYNGQIDPTTSQPASCAPASALLPDGAPVAVVCKRIEQATTDATGTNGLSATMTGSPRVWSYTYNAFGQVLTTDGPRTDVSDTTVYTYYDCDTGYQCGQVATLTNALGHTTTFNSYDAHGQPLSITDPNGVVTIFTYDLRQRLKTRTAGNEQTVFDYWPTGLLKKATLPDGSYLEYAYDSAHRLTDIIDSEGNRIHYTLDNAGNRTNEQLYDPYNTLATTRTRVFDALSRISQEIGAANTAAVTTSFLYDNNGNQREINQPLARKTVQTFDELNRLTQITDPANGVIKYGYDGLDQLISVTDPSNKVTSYTINGLGDLTQQVSPDTGTTINTYDSAGNLETSTDARNKTATYQYDALNRVTSIAHSDQTIGLTYDTGSNQNGRLTQITDSSGSTSWTYDPQGRITSRTQNMGAVIKAVGYAYDLNGQLQTLTLPSGNQVTFGYANGKISSLTLNGATTILDNVLYQPFGPTAGWTWGNGTLAVRNYDQDGKITLADSAGLKTYVYDDAFRITDITDATDPNLSQSYGYDSLDRLTSATGSTLNQSWTYDANGNRLTQGGSQASTYTVSTTSNRVNSISGALTRSYGYDNAGNTTSDGSVTYTYNDAGRMISATKSGVTSTYALNGLGQRVRKNTSGVSTYFVYDEAGHHIGEYDGSGNLLTETIWFDDIPVATIRPNGTGVDLFYIHTDHLNTPRRISRPSDNVVVWRWDSDPFGTTPANEDPDGDSTLFAYNLRFPGQYFDSETGLLYNYYRDYDPSTGRYVQSDPIGLEGGINTYSYALANPVSKFDPDGRIVFAIPALPAILEGIVFVGSAVGAGIGIGEMCRTKEELDKDEECYEKCKHLLPSPSGDLQTSEYRECYRKCKGSL